MKDEVISKLKKENDKKRLAEAIHALNDLYEAINHYTDKYGLNDCLELEEALEQADKVLEGN